MGSPEVSLPTLMTLTFMSDRNEPDMEPQDGNTNITTPPETATTINSTGSNLIQSLKTQWSQNLVMGQTRRATYTEMGQIIEFMNRHDSG